AHLCDAVRRARPGGRRIGGTLDDRRLAPPLGCDESHRAVCDGWLADPSRSRGLVVVLVVPTPRSAGILRLVRQFFRHARRVARRALRTDAGRADARTQAMKWAPRFLMGLTVAIYVGSAGIPALLDDADSLFAEVAREMNVRHDWITPYTNTIRFLEKPPIFCWLMSISYAVFRSATAFTARLPTALAVTALVFVTYQIGKLVFGQRAGVLGGLTLATSAGTFLFTRIVLPEPILTLWLTLFFYCFLRWERAASKATSLMWMYVFAALAVLT